MQSSERGIECVETRMENLKKMNDRFEIDRNITKMMIHFNTICLDYEDTVMC